VVAFGSTAALKVNTTGAVTETPDAPSAGSLVTVVWAEMGDKPIRSKSADRPSTEKQPFVAWDLPGGSSAELQKPINFRVPKTPLERPMPRPRMNV
jgi:hypothetical protein